MGQNMIWFALERYQFYIFEDSIEDPKPWKAKMNSNTTGNCKKDEPSHQCKDGLISPISVYKEENQARIVWIVSR